MGKRTRYFLDPKNRRGELFREAQSFWVGSLLTGCLEAQLLMGEYDGPWRAVGQDQETALLPWEV